MSDEVLLEPLARQCGHPIECAWLFELVCGPRNDLEPGLGLDVRHRALIELDHFAILAPHDEQRRGGHFQQRVPRQVGPAAPGHYGTHFVRLRCGGHERRSRPRAGAKQPERQRRLIADLVDDRDHSTREKLDIESKVPRNGVDSLLFCGQEIHQDGVKPALAQAPRHKLVASAVTAAAAPVNEQDDASGARRHVNISLEHRIVYFKTSDLMLHSQSLPYQCTVACAGDRVRSSRTSSSVVCEKSSYQAPTAMNPGGVRRQTISSTSI